MGTQSAETATMPPLRGATDMRPATGTTPAADDPGICATIQADDQEQEQQQEQEQELPANQTQAHTAPATTPKPPRMPSKAANTPDPPQHTTQTPERHQDPATGRESASEEDAPLLPVPKQTQTGAAGDATIPATTARQKHPYARPGLTPALRALKIYPCTDAVLEMMHKEDIRLEGLGESQAHALGLLSALLVEGSHKRAFERTGLCWPYIHIFGLWDEGFTRLYQAVLGVINSERVQILRDEAMERATKGQPRGVYWNGKQVATEYYPSDKLTELLLRGLDPETFGAAGESGPAVAVQVNIGV